MSDHEMTADEIKKSAGKYWKIFFVLLFGTALTVAVSYYESTVLVAFIIGLAIATTKGALVAGYFMHLFHEAKMIYQILAVMLIFFFILLLLPVLTMLGGVKM